MLHCERLETREVPADLRVVSYNITATGGTVRDGIVGVLGDSTTANDHGILDTIGMQTVGGLTRPADIILLQETDSSASAGKTVASRLNAYYGSSLYVAGTVVGGTTGGGTQGIVYRTTTVDLLEQLPIGTTSGSGAARQPVRYKVRADGNTTDIYIYNAHMKASDTSADAQRRLVEAQAIRDNADALPSDAHILYVGDFNFYDSNGSEPAYGKLRAAGNAQAVDVVAPAGNWKRESSNWVSIYTQAPSSSPSGGLVGGGLDDRFDFILMTGEFTDGTGIEYVGGSYRTFGNNGSVAVNGSVNIGSNSSLNNIPLSSTERQAVLNYLTTASDHLPVVADFFVPDQTPGSLQFSSAAFTVSEANSTATITVTRTDGTAGPVSVNYMATPGSATPAQDFTPVSGTLTFADGQTSASIAVPIHNDEIDEAAETIVLNLSTATGGALLGAPATAILTIVDNDPPPSIFVADGIAVEGNSGTVPLTLTVTLSTASSLPISVSYTTNDVTAVAVSDYQASNGTISFQPGETVQFITVQVVGDTLIEPDETFELSLSNPINALTGDLLGLATISDDDSGDVRLSVGTPRTDSATGPDLMGPAAAGSMIYVPIRLQVTKLGGLNATNISSTNIAVGFDNTRLEYLGAFRGGVLDTTSSFAPPSVSTGSLRLSSFDSNGTEFSLDQGAEGDLYIVQFVVRDNANGNANVNLLQNLTAPTFSTRLSAPSGTIYSILPQPTNGADDPAIDREIPTTNSVPLTVSGFTVNGGDPQRSRVARVQLTFNGDVTLSPSNFQLTNTTTGMLFTGLIGVLPQTVNGQTVATLSFSGTGTEFGSLEDGRYTLTVTGVSGLTGPNSFDFFRLFGDINGDGTVDGPNDFAQFGGVFGTTTVGNPFDFNDDGTIDGSTDFAQFGGRFGRTV